MLLEITISRNDGGQRAERYLRRYFPAMSLDRLHSLFRRKEIKIARKPIKRSDILQAGDVVQVYGLKEEEAAVKPASESGGDLAIVFNIPILHEDDDLLVLDKPAHMAVHPGTGIPPGESVIEKVRARLAAERWEEELFQASLVHRLDKDTSGVLIVAKTGESLRRLTAAMRDRSFTKRYLALVEGVPNPREGEISGNLQRVDSRGGGAKAEVSEEEGKWSITRYKTVKELGNFSLLSVIIETGRMHQIRAHLAHIGHPVVGDSRYGSFERNRGYRKSLGLKRTFLHSSDLELELGQDKRLSFHAPLPKDLSTALDRLKELPTSQT